MPPPAGRCSLRAFTDALLTADSVPSPVHLSLEASHRRGWGSLYAALDRGRIDAEALRGLLARYPLAGRGTTPVYAGRRRERVGSLRRGEQPRERGFYYQDRKSTRLNSSHANISYAVFCLK